MFIPGLKRVDFIVIFLVFEVIAASIHFSFIWIESIVL